MHKGRNSADGSEISFTTTNGPTARKHGRNKFKGRSQSLPGQGMPVKLNIPPGAKILCFCKSKQFQMPNLSALESKSGAFHQGTTASGAGFGDAMSGIGPDGLCEHAKTTDVKLVSDILLSQVENLSKTDKNY